MFDLPSNPASHQSFGGAASPGLDGNGDSEPLGPVPAVTTLAELPLGARARVVGIDGGRELSRRLLALGVRTGSELRVEHHRGRGRVVSIGPARVALGGGIVEKLRVEPLHSQRTAHRASSA